LLGSGFFSVGLNTDVVNFYSLPELLGFYRHNTTEKHWYRPNRLAYPFELKGDVSCTYMNGNRAALWFVERVYGGKHDRQTIKQLRRYFCAQYLFRAVCLKSTSLLRIVGFLQYQILSACALGLGKQSIGDVLLTFLALYTITQLFG